MPMVAVSTSLEGVRIIEVEHFGDARGFFYESYHRQKFAALGITAEFVQDNHSRSAARVLRGLHYQDMTAPMGKLVRCTLGKILDVAVDVRAGSPTFAKWVGVDLTAANVRQLWVPPGFAHGFVVLSEVAEVQYKCTNFYTPSAERVLAWNDPEVSVEWRVADPILSKRDQNGMSLKQYLEKPAFHYPS